MARIREYLKFAAAMGLILATGHVFQPAARGQGAIAFTPEVGFIPNGATLSVTPAVSADRRYVRLSVNPFFNTINGFTTYTAPLGAVGGGGAGGFAGMNGPIGGGGAVGGGMGGGAGVAGQMGMPFTGTYLAGDYPPAIAGFQQDAGAGFDRPIARTDGGFDASDPLDAGRNAFSDAELDEGQTVRRAAPRSKSARQKAVRKPARRPATTKTTARRR